MHSEVERSEGPADANAPATKGDVYSVARDLDKLAEASKSSVDQNEHALRELTLGQARLQETVSTALEHLASIEQPLSGLPERIERLERSVFSRG